MTVHQEKIYYMNEPPEVATWWGSFDEKVCRSRTLINEIQTTSTALIIYQKSKVDFQCCLREDSWNRGWLVQPIFFQHQNYWPLQTRWGAVRLSHSWGKTMFRSIFREMWAYHKTFNSILPQISTTKNMFLNLATNCNFRCDP